MRGNRDLGNSHQDHIVVGDHGAVRHDRRRDPGAGNRDVPCEEPIDFSEGPIDPIVRTRPLRGSVWNIRSGPIEPGLRELSEERLIGLGLHNPVGLAFRVASHLFLSSRSWRLAVLVLKSPPITTGRFGVVLIDQGDQPARAFGAIVRVGMAFKMNRDERHRLSAHRDCAATAIRPPTRGSPNSGSNQAPVLSSRMTAGRSS